VLRLQGKDHGVSRVVLLDSNFRARSAGQDRGEATPFIRGSSRPPIVHD
jgi:hypothetical protein